MKRTKQFLALFIVALLVMSCDKDYNTIGSDLVNGNHFGVKDENHFEIKSTNVRLDGLHPVQTNNLSYNTLGYYNDPIYGETTANVLSQVALSEYGNENLSSAVLTKIVLSIPYYSTKTATNDDGTSEYELDSIYGNTPINLRLFRSNYFLNDFDPNSGFEDRQKYYSDEDNDATSQFNLDSHNTDLLYEDLAFSPSSSEIPVDGFDDEGEPETTYLSPRLRVEISDLTNFSWLLDPVNTEALSSVNNFRNFFRGIYIQTSIASGVNDGVYMGVNLSNAEIEFTYEYNDPGGEIGADPIEDTIKMIFSGNSVNTFENNFNYTEDVDKIYLKGGEGAMSIINIFSGLDDDGDGVSNELEDLRSRNIVINEANLEFFVDQDAMQPIGNELERIFLFDIDNNTVLLDYTFDNTNSSDPNLSKTTHLGKLERDNSGNGVKYKIRITEHVTNLIRKDSTNVSLGLMATNNVSLLGSSSLKTPYVVGYEDVIVNNDGDPVNDENNDIINVLTSSVNTHRGTVLFNENAVDDTKKLKLRIIYTEEDN
jgi:hypothetical protein